MKLDILDNRDFWAGLMLIGTGVAAMAIAYDYPFGSSLRMGPGYFPTVLGAVLVLFGLIIAIRGLRSGEKIEGNWSLRALIVVPLAFVLFGVVMQYAGFIAALTVLIVGAAAASSEFKFIEIALLTLVLVALSVVVFIWVLGLPYPLFPEF